jgi:hypothetical protein
MNIAHAAHYSAFVASASASNTAVNQVAIGIGVDRDSDPYVLSRSGAAHFDKCL